MVKPEIISLYIEGVKAISAVSIPIIIAFLGVRFNRAQKVYESRLDIHRDIISHRLANYREIALLINDIYCFHALVGHYKSMNPEIIINKKRELENIVFTNLPLWTDGFCHAFMIFIDICYATSRGRLTSPVSLADIVRHQEEHGNDWQTNWNDYFLTPENRKVFLEENRGLSKNGSYRKDLLQPAYAALLSEMSLCIGGNLSFVAAKSMI